MIISAIVGLFATATLAVKTFWYRIKSFFRNDRAAVPGGDEPSSPDADRSLDS